MLNKKGLSPLMATLVLVVFALIIGTITMTWGKSYVSNLEVDKPAVTSSIVISIQDVDTPLKELQIRHITGRISEEEYFFEETKLRS